MAELTEVEITLDRVVEIWWAQAWRVWAVGILAVIALWIPADLYLPSVAPYLTIATYIFLFFWNIKAMGLALRKPYEGFRVALVSVPSPAGVLR